MSGARGAGARGPIADRKSQMLPSSRLARTKCPTDDNSLLLAVVGNSECVLNLACRNAGITLHGN